MSVSRWATPLSMVQDSYHFCPNCRLVLETLSPLPKDRKCFRMINGVLVERTVKDVLPALETNSVGLKKVLDELVKQYKRQQEEMEKWKVGAMPFQRCLQSKICVRARTSAVAIQKTNFRSKANDLGNIRRRTTYKLSSNKGTEDNHRCRHGCYRQLYSDVQITQHAQANVSSTALRHHPRCARIKEYAYLNIVSKSRLGGHKTWPKVLTLAKPPNAGNIHAILPDVLKHYSPCAYLLD